MAYTPGANDAFQSGINHQVLDSHENTQRITLDGALQADDDRWNSDVQNVATTPHSVLVPYSFSRKASANGSDGSRFILGYGQLGSGDGDSADTYDKNMSLRMAGDSSAEVD